MQSRNVNSISNFGLSCPLLPPPPFKTQLCLVCNSVSHTGISKQISSTLQQWKKQGWCVCVCVFGGFTQRCHLSLLNCSQLLGLCNRGDVGVGGWVGVLRPGGLGVHLSLQQCYSSPSHPLTLKPAFGYQVVRTRLRRSQ